MVSIEQPKCNINQIICNNEKNAGSKTNAGSDENHEFNKIIVA